MTTLVAQEIAYLSQGDEDAFFGWLNTIKCIASVHGSGRALLIEIIDDRMTDADLMELIALFHRYGIDKKQLAQLLTSSNAAWFRNDDRKYWHRDVFGS